MSEINPSTNPHGRSLNGVTAPLRGYPLGDVVTFFRPARTIRWGPHLCLTPSLVFQRVKKYYKNVKSFLVGHM